MQPRGERQRDISVTGCDDATLPKFDVTVTGAEGTPVGTSVTIESNTVRGPWPVCYTSVLLA
eukprot:4193148-Pyramimonas_sp.AAC.1